MSEPIIITIPSSIANQHLPLLIEKLCQIDSVKVIDEKNDKIKDIVARLYVHCQTESINMNVNKKLLGCLSSNAYEAFCEFLDWIEEYETEHCIVLEFLSHRVNHGVYASIVEDDDFNQKLVDLLLTPEDDDLEDVLRSYNANKNTTFYKTAEASREFLNQGKANMDEPMPSLNGEKVNLDTIIAEAEANPNMDKARKLANMDDDKFESILLSLGLDDVGMTKARKIKSDVQSGKQLNMMEIMAFAQEYKTNIDAANLDIGKLMGLLFSNPSESETVKDGPMAPVKDGSNTPEPAMPFDLNGLMNMVGPMLSNFTNQPKKGNRNRRR